MMTIALEKSFDDAHTKLLRYALNVLWRDHVKNVDLYRTLSRVSDRLRQRRLILIRKKTGTARRGSPAKYLTDLDFADDIVLFGSSIPNAQKLLSNIEKDALKVGLKIKQGKAEYITF